MEILRDYAMRMVGLPYIWGGDDTVLGFDCSGLVQELLASVGMDPPGDQSAQTLYDHFVRQCTIRHNRQEVGSLAFYGLSVTKITHVAMMIDPWRIVEAGGGGSRNKTAEDAAKYNAYVRIRLLDHRKDRVALLKPSYASIGVA